MPSRTGMLADNLSESENEDLFRIVNGVKYAVKYLHGHIHEGCHNRKDDDQLSETVPSSMVSTWSRHFDHRRPWISRLRRQVRVTGRCCRPSLALAAGC